MASVENETNGTSTLFRGVSSGRSSTSSHFSKDYETITSGTASHDFYGIPITTDIAEDASLKTVGILLLLIFLAFLKPHLKPLRSTGTSIIFWAAIFAAAYTIKEITYYPLLSTIIFTRTSYPYLVVVPHCISAAASYRKERSSELHYLSAFGFGFFCYGFGGSIVSDVLMGLPATALAHARIIPSYILGWALVWFSPNDIVYQLLNDKSSFFHYFMNACEAVDAVTTPMGRVSRSARELQNKRIAPIIAGLLAGTGGAAIRYGERVVLRKGDDRVAQESFNALEAGVWRTLTYSILWWYIAVHKCRNEEYENPEENHCHEYNGHNLYRFVIVVAHVLWNFACDLGYANGHPFVFLCEKLRNVGSKAKRMLYLGPQPIVKTVKSEKTD